MITTLKDFKLITEKSETQSYSSGCIMGYFDMNEPFVHPIIDENDLYNNEENEYGLEIEDHVTVLYGLHDDEINEEGLLSLLKIINCPIVDLTGITLFQNEKYDVVKYDVINEDLVSFNNALSKLVPNTQSFPDYHAHSTIAYCKPGSGEKYVQMFDEPIKRQISYWVYSKANGKKYKVDPVTKQIEVLRDATN